MLYIEDDTRELWPSVARALASLETLDMVLCLCEGSGPEHFVAPFLAADTYEYFEPVASYAEGAVPKCSRRVSVDEELLAWLEPRTGEFEEWGDYLALYRPRSYDLVAAVIPHEGIILVADEFGSDVAASGIRLSDEPPDWWQERGQSL